MIKILILILMLYYSGLMILNFYEEKIKLSKIIYLSFPLGITFHTLIFSFLIFFHIYYNFILFVIVTLFLTLSIFKRKLKIENDLKNIPFYLIVIIVFFVFRLIQLGVTGFYDFYNYDEISAYQNYSNQIYFYNNYKVFFGVYAPINYFLGTKSYELVGYSINLVRIFSPIFLVLTSFFIYLTLKQNKVNRNIAALISILFLFSSTELIQLSKTFYTNIFFMYYFIISTYSLLKYYFIDNKKGVPRFELFIFLGLLLTRKDALILGLFLICFFSFINLIKKRINIKEFVIITLSFVTLFLIYNTFNHFNGGGLGVGSSENNSSILYRVLERLETNNFHSFLYNIYDQTFKFGYYYMNWLIYFIFILSSVITIYVTFNKKYRDNFIRPLLFWSSLFQYCYFSLVIITQFLFFAIGEFLVAASFSRYTITVIPISFITTGIFIFRDTNEKDETHPLLFLLMISSLIPVFIEKFIFYKVSFNFIRAIIIFFIVEMITILIYNNKRINKFFVKNFRIIKNILTFICTAFIISLFLL